MVDKTKVNGTKGNKELKIFEAFAGMGAQRKALENENINYKVVGLAEWFVPAIVSYQAIHNGLNENTIDKKTSREEMEEYLSGLTLSIDSKVPANKGIWKKKHLDELRIIYTAVKSSQKEGNIFDVRTLYKRKLEDVDLLTYSFPCQDLSQQGIQKGMKKGSGTRSGLLWEIEKALDATPKNKLPKYLLMENVMALMSKPNENELNDWIRKLESLGYHNDIQILNSADFGSSQARRRAYMISSRINNIKLPKGDKKPQPLNKVLDKNPTKKDFMPALDKFDYDEFKLTKSNINKTKLKKYSTFNSEAYVYDPNYTGPTLTASGANSRIKILYNNKIRKLNAREAYKYMGFDEQDYNNVNDLNFLKEEKMIYTCGNSISVEVLQKIFKELK